jgi:hypothetical protein
VEKVKYNIKTMTSIKEIGQIMYLMVKENMSNIKIVPIKVSSKMVNTMEKESWNIRQVIAIKENFMLEKNTAKESMIGRRRMVR